MDKLKYVKLENPDGSYSDNIPLAVDSDHVDVNGASLTTELANKATKTEVNSAVSNLSTVISSLASGSPAGVYATVAALTTADPDHSKIYVVSADGHWYYYNSGWQDGGVYQATSIQDESITYHLLDNNLNNLFIKDIIFLEKTNLIENKRCRKDGSTLAFSDDSYYNYYKIDISEYIGYELLYTGGSYYNVPTIFITDINNNVLYNTSSSGVYRLKPESDLIQISTSMKYCYLNMNKGNAVNSIRYNIGIVKQFKNTFEYNEISMLNPITIVNDFYLSDTNSPDQDGTIYYSPLSGSSVKSYRLNKNQKYKITGKNWAESCAFILTDNSTIIQIKSTALYETNENFEYIFTSSFDGYIFTTYHSTNSPTSVYIYNKINSTIIASPTTLGIVKIGDSLEIDNEGILNIKNYMKNIKIGFTGDSICAQNGGYATILHNMYGLNIQNIAVGGGHLANDESPFCISDSIDDLASDCDGYIIEGGINDHANGVPLGQLSNNYTDTLDQGTLYGALEKICRDLYTYHYGKYFAFLIVHNVTNRYYTKIGGYNFKEYREAIYAVCEKYGIDIIDIGAKSSMNTYDSNMKELYTLPYQGHGDGLHPNTNGYTKFYIPEIKSWIDKKFNLY